MDENALKRKRELEGEADVDMSEPESSDLDMDITKEKPLEGIKSKAKKQKTQPVEPEDHEDDEAAETRALSKAEAKAEAKAEKRREKRKEKQAKNKQKLEAKKAQKTAFTGLAATDKTEEPEDEDKEEDQEEDGDDTEHPEDRMQALDVSGLVEEGQSTAPSTTANSNSSTASVASAASSTSSMPQSNEEVPSKKAKKPYTIDPQSHENFRARLASENTFRRRVWMEGSQHGGGSFGHQKNNSNDYFTGRPSSRGSYSGQAETHPPQTPPFLSREDQTYGSIQVSDKHTSFRGYVFSSPWDGRCEFVTGVGGGSLKVT